MRTFDDERILEQTISTERVYDGVILHIDRLTNRLPNGKLALREVARHIGASAVLLCGALLIAASSGKKKAKG